MYFPLANNFYLLLAFFGRSFCQPKLVVKVVSLDFVLGMTMLAFVLLGVGNVVVCVSTNRIANNTVQANRTSFSNIMPMFGRKTENKLKYG